MRWWQTKGTAKRDAELERELHSDLELEEEEQRERGLSRRRSPLCRTARLRQPGADSRADARGLDRIWLERLVRDLKYGTRTLFRSPGFLSSLCW